MVLERRLGAAARMDHRGLDSLRVHEREPEIVILEGWLHLAVSLHELREAFLVEALAGVHLVEHGARDGDVALHLGKLEGIGAAVQADSVEAERLRLVLVSDEVRGG